jgi:hypothetical protein
MWQQAWPKLSQAVQGQVMARVHELKDMPNARRDQFKLLLGVQPQQLYRNANVLQKPYTPQAGQQSPAPRASGKHKAPEHLSQNMMTASEANKSSLRGE